MEGMERCGSLARFHPLKQMKKCGFAGGSESVGVPLGYSQTAKPRTSLHSASVEFNTASEPMMVNNIDIYHRDCGHQDPPQKKAKIITIRDNGQRNF